MSRKPAASALSVSLAISFTDTRWKKKSTELRPLLRRAVRAALVAEQVRGRVALSVQCADDALLRSLNHDFRGKDKPTNVLSFPDGSDDEGVRQLGDIAISLETVAREAKEQKKTFAAHLLHLTVHGVLHLLGHDHEAEAEAEAMESMEIDVLQRLNIKNPYR